ncbi:MAG TPA: NAD(+)/NADH kinase [Candidatus Acidoferrales bacterium]|jgi:NAD+ kinase|nr:NAD(+)/NADH kinase [Candidatus Acidoferrales bacterium]
MTRTVGIISKPRKEEIWAVVPPLQKWLESRGAQVLLDPETAACCPPGAKEFAREELARRSDFLIVLGGDGTLLAAARLLADRQVPILPVNLGGLGFLTSVTLDEMYPLLEQLLAGKHETSERMMLEAHVLRGGEVVESQRALNDAVLTKSDLARMIDFDLYVDGDFVGRYRADGIIVSTPTGSTAYSLSAGGPILYPLLQAFVITPICPHMLTNRPLVVPESARMEIHFIAGDDVAHLTLDGQMGLEVKSGDRIRIGKSAARVLLIRPPKKTYFEVLRNKLRWAER